MFSESKDGVKPMDLKVIWITRELLELYEYITTEELAKRIGVSDSSVRHRMVEVKEGFKKHGIAVESSQRRGIRIEATTAQRDRMYNYIQSMAQSTSESKEYRKKYIFDTLFEYSDNYTIQLFAADLFSSKKIVSRDLREVEEMLSDYHLKLIVKRNSGVMIEGNEFHVRQAMIAYYNSIWWDKVYVEKPETVDARISQRAWSYMKRIYSDVDIIEIQKALLAAEQKLGVVWTDVAFSRLLEYIVVSVRRIRKNWVITELHAEDLLPLKEEYLYAAEELLDKLTGKTCAPQEIQYMAARMYITETIMPYMGRGDEKYKADIKSYLNRVGCVTVGYDIAEDERLVSSICDLLVEVEYRENYNIKSWNDLNREIKETESALYATCLLYIYILARKSGLKFSQDDVARITLLIDNFMKNHQREVVVVTATDEASATYQMQKLHNAFPKFKFTEIVHYRQFDHRLYEGKTIISTVSLPLEEGEYYLISKHVSREDISRLGEIWKGEENVSLTSFQELLQEELIWEINARSKKDAVYQICEFLAQKGYNSEEFEKKILEQEEFIPTSIGNGMAVPHVLDENIGNEFVAVIKLKHRILWGEEDYVNWLFFMAYKPSHIDKAAAFLLDVCAESNIENGNICRYKELGRNNNKST